MNKTDKRRKKQKMMGIGQKAERIQILRQQKKVRRKRLKSAFD